MRYLSICSGIEAASCAWHDLNWEAVGFSEIDAFPSAVLSYRFPSVINFGDMTHHAQWNIEPGSVDLVVGGTPCQAFSVAGLRAGMADPRGNLALTFLSIVDRLRPEWVVWENVPGVLSSNGGRDFGAFLGSLVELGYGFSYRVLDAQNFGVAQRRRRVFVVANATDWRRSAAVLFEPESLRGNPAPSRTKGQVAAASVRNGAPSSAERSPLIWREGDQANASHCVDFAGTLNCNKGQQGGIIAQPVAPTLDASYHKGPGMRGGQERAFVGVQIVPPAPVVIDRAAFNQGVGAQYATRIEASETMSALVAKGPHAVAHAYAVRRLTPVECERLQGFPDDWTAIPYRGKSAADGPRYKAIGNSMAVPVMRWIGERIDAVDRATKEQP